MTDTQKAEPTIFERFAEPFPHDVVEWRADQITGSGDKAMALCYIDARSVMARLDEVVGPQNWQDCYREEGGRIICRISVRVEGEWISKEDGAGDTNFEGEKGGISSALKRCGVKWGIGRYLYDIDKVWAPCTVAMRNGEMVKNQKGKPIWRGWTDAGQRLLDDALRAAPGPRQTGRPFAVDKMGDLLRTAETIDELAKIWTAHWATIPLAYRKEILETKEARKQFLQARAKNEETQ